MLKNLIRKIKNALPVVLIGSAYTIVAFNIEKLEDNTVEASRRLSYLDVAESEKIETYFLDLGVLGRAEREGRGNYMGDMNGDRLLDFVKIKDGKLVIYQNDNQGYYFERGVGIINKERFADHNFDKDSKIIVHDFNGDSLNDIVIMDRDKNLRFLQRFK